MREIKLTERIKLAFSNESTITSILQRYAEDFLGGEDVPTSTQSPMVGNNALKYSAVFACNRVLAETLASCPIHQYEKAEDGSRKAITNTKEYELLHYAPNPDMTPVQLKETGAANINLGGNFYAQKVRNGSGEVIQLRPITYDRVEIIQDKKTSKLSYIIDGDRDNPWTRDKILHIPGLTLDGYIGITPIEYCQTALQVGQNQEVFERNFYLNRASSSGVFQYPNELGDDAFARLKKEIKANYVGLKNAGVPMILEGGGTFREVTMKLTDAQFIESKRFRIEDIARIYRVPLHLIGDLQRSTNNNIEHQSLEFIVYTMLPWFKRWEENLNLQMMSKEDHKKGRYFEFKIDALLRGDVAARSEAYAKGRQWGYLSANDIRRLENMNPIPNGDIYVQPLNYIEAGKEAEQQNEISAMTEQIFKMLKERT